MNDRRKAQFIATAKGELIRFYDARQPNDLTHFDIVPVVRPEAWNLRHAPVDEQTASTLPEVSGGWSVCHYSYPDVVNAISEPTFTCMVYIPSFALAIDELSSEIVHEVAFDFTLRPKLVAVKRADTWYEAISTT